MTPRSIPQVVLFDLDDTLFDHASAARAALMGVHQSHASFSSRAFDAFELDHAAHLEDLHRRVIAGTMGIDEARIERFRRLFAQSGVDAEIDLLQQIAAAYRSAYLASRAPVAGARDLLAAVRAHARVGIVSNNLLEEQREKLRECGFEPYVDALIVSEETGVWKPDPGIFAIALERLDCSAEHAVMVGDSWAADVEGARAAGIRPVWFNRRRQPVPQIAGDAIETIEAFVPLPPVLDVILRRPAGERQGAGYDVECRA